MTHLESEQQRLKPGAKVETPNGTILEVKKVVEYLPKGDMSGPFVIFTTGTWLFASAVIVVESKN